MNITQQLCCPGAAENQDYIRLEESIAMVVDGSTPLVKDPRVPEVREYRPSWSLAYGSGRLHIYRKKRRSWG